MIYLLYNRQNIAQEPILEESVPDDACASKLNIQIWLKTFDSVTEKPKVEAEKKGESVGDDKVHSET